jgi:hypothetical protein
MRVGADLIRRTPPIALSGASSAFTASVRNGWPRRWVPDKNAIGGQEEPAALGIQPLGTDCASALNCQAFDGGGAGGR